MAVCFASAHQGADRAHRAEKPQESANCGSARERHTGVLVTPSGGVKKSCCRSPTQFQSKGSGWLPVIAYVASAHQRCSCSALTDTQSERYVPKKDRKSVVSGHRA